MIATSTGRAPTAIAPSRVCGVVGTDVRRRASGTRADATWGATGAPRDRRRRRRTPAHPGRLPPTRRRRAPRRPRRPASVPSSATKGTTSSAPRRGCTPTWWVTSSWSATARAERPRRMPPRRGGRVPRCVNTARWWSASRVHVEQRAPARDRERVEHRGDRAPPTRSGTHSSTRAGYDGADRLPARMRLGLALPQFDYSVGGSSPLRWDTIVEYATRGGARRIRLAVVVRPPLLQRREVRRPARCERRFRARHHARSARARRQPSTARHARDLRGAASRVGARQGARIARRDRARSPRRRARRGLVRARVRRDRHGDAARRRSARTAARRDHRVPRAARRVGRSRTRARTTARSTREQPTRIGTAADAADHRRRARATACSESSPSSPMVGTPCGRGRTTTTANGSLVLERACEAGRPRSGDREPFARPLRAVRRGRSRPRAPVRADGRDHAPRCARRHDPRPVAGGTAGGHRRAGAGAARGGGRSSASTRS